VNTFIVMADVGTDWPETFGPYIHLTEAYGVKDELDADERIASTEVVALLPGDSVTKYLEDLDDLQADWAD
jgi:hypothetical protein